MRMKAMWAALGLAGALGVGEAKADLTCWPTPLATKEPIVIRMCQDALEERMIVLTNESPALDARPILAGCALTFADGKRKIARWKPGKIGPKQEARERAPLKGLPEPVSAVCEIERVELTLEGEGEEAPARKSEEVIPPQDPRFGSARKRKPPTLIIRPVLRPDLVIDGPAEPEG